MYYMEYVNLSSADKKVYTSLVQQMQYFQTEFKLKNVDGKTVSRLYFLVAECHPEFFWLKNTMHCTITTRGSESEIVIRPDLSVKSPATVRKMQHELNAEVTKILSQVSLFGSTYDKVKYVHDYLVQNVQYTKHVPYEYQAYGCLVKKRCVCSGFSRAFRLLLQKMGIVCGTVSGYPLDASGEKRELHMWNYVKMDDGFYFFDVTHDRSCYQAYGMNAAYQYFGLTTKELLKTHIIESKYYVPACRLEHYNYYQYTRSFLAVYKPDAYDAIAARQLKKGRCVCVKFGSPSETKRAAADLVTGHRFFKLIPKTQTIHHSISDSGLHLTIFY